ESPRRGGACRKGKRAGRRCAQAQAAGKCSDVAQKPHSVPERADRPPKTTGRRCAKRIQRSRPLRYVGQNSAVSGAGKTSLPSMVKRTLSTTRRDCVNAFT